jgi:mannose-1-phosphate guanylyltransferase
MSLYAVILAGGVGARFWPRSRQHCPKQYLGVFSEQSLIQETVERIASLVPEDRVLVVTREDQVSVLQEQLPNLEPWQILKEPVGRSTAPCLALAAHTLLHRDPEATMLVLPSDHLIQDTPLFLETVERAVATCEEKDALITFGIQPNRPETGYGYILYSSEAVSDGVHKVKQFVEKPDLATARRYVQSERYLWNSGMFVWQASTLVDEIRTYLPALMESIEALPADPADPDFDTQLKATYLPMEPLSIDHGLMEKSKQVYVIKSYFGWSDVGSWESVYHMSDRDPFGNVLRGEVHAIDTHNSYIYSPHRFAATIGVENLIVVDTPDALLISSMQRSQEVRDIVKHLETQKKDRLL